MHAWREIKEKDDYYVTSRKQDKGTAEHTLITDILVAAQTSCVYSPITSAVLTWFSCREKSACLQELQTNVHAPQVLNPPTTSCSPAPPSTLWDARHGPVWWMPTGSFGDRLRYCGRLWTLPYSLDWRSSMARNAEEEVCRSYHSNQFGMYWWYGKPTHALWVMCVRPHLLPRCCACWQISVYWQAHALFEWSVYGLTLRGAVLADSYLPNVWEPHYGDRMMLDFWYLPTKSFVLKTSGICQPNHLF